jgi:hypothetical protein
MCQHLAFPRMLLPNRFCPMTKEAPDFRALTDWPPGFGEVDGLDGRPDLSRLAPSSLPFSSCTLASFPSPTNNLYSHTAATPISVTTTTFLLLHHLPTSSNTSQNGFRAGYVFLTAADVIERFSTATASYAPLSMRTAVGLVFEMQSITQTPPSRPAGSRGGLRDPAAMRTRAAGWRIARFRRHIRRDA